MLTTSRIRRLKEQASRFLESAPETSADACLRLFKAGITSEPLLEIMVAALCKLGKFDQATVYLKALLEIHPENFEYNNQLVDCYKVTANLSELDLLYNKIAHLLSGDSQWIHLAIKICNILKKHQEAESYAKQLLAQDSNTADCYAMLGWHQQSLGKLDLAEKSYNKVIELNPDNIRARYALSALNKQTVSNNHIDELKKTLSTSRLNDFETASIHSALGKEYEDIKDYDNAFAHFSNSASIMNRLQHYSYEADTRVHQAMMSWFSKSLDVSTRNGYQSISPIFIVGMPRTGSTLLDRILSSHSHIASAGEIMCFRMAFQHILGDTTKGDFFESYFERSQPLTNYYKIGARYANLSSAVAGTQVYFIDKLPMNYFFLGFIGLALPNAKFIVSHRSAMDTCFSNYKQLFGENYYSYSYDFTNTANHFSVFKKTINFWQNHFKDRMYNAHYEKLINTPEVEIRSLLNFLGLPFEQNCLDFHKNSQSVDTASSSQVRQPLYSSSVEKWRNYEKHLGLLQNRLEVLGVFS